MDLNRPMGAMIATLLLGALLLAPLGAYAQSLLIPVPDRRDHVFDPSRQLLYITTTSGNVERYDVNAQTLLSSYSAGTSLTGVDITPDNAYLYVGDEEVSETQGFIRKVNLTSGAVTSIPYDRESNEGGVWMLKIGSQGKGLFTISGSGWSPLKELVLSNDTINFRDDVPGSGISGEVSDSAMISRGSDRSFFFFSETAGGPGQTFFYNAIADNFIPVVQTQVGIANQLSSVNKDGTLIAAEFDGAISILDRQRKTVEILKGETGVIFHPTDDLLYVGDVDGIIVYDTNSWGRLGRIPLGESIPSSRALNDGVMSISDNGDLLFVSTPDGVRMLATDISLELQ